MAGPRENYQDRPVENSPWIARKLPEGTYYYPNPNPPQTAPGGSNPEAPAPQLSPWEKYNPTPQAAPQAAPWDKYAPPAELKFEPTGDPIADKLKSVEAPKNQYDIFSPETGMFPFNYYNTQSKNASHAVEQMGQGVEQLGTSGERLKGAFNTAVGGLSYLASPIESALESIAGKPIENATGMPKEYTDFTLGLALPGIGFAKAPKTLQKIFSPDTVSQDAMDAAALIRKNTGRSARDILSSEDMYEPYQKLINTMSPAQQMELAKFIDGSPGAAVPATPELRAFADAFKGDMQKYRALLEKLPQHSQMQFYEEYFPHMWKDPTAALNAVNAGKVGPAAYKQGSAASTKQRTMSTLQQGIDAGLEPVTTNPIEVGIRYATSIRKYIASQEILTAAVKDGTVIYVRPQVMGASGRPGSVKIPPGYAPLEGRGATGAMGERAYAPEDWARVYNNFISRGFEQAGGGEYGAAYNVARRGANAITQMVLSFSGYHAFTMSEASMSSQVGKAVQEIRKGTFGGAAKELGKYAIAPISYPLQARRINDTYLNKIAATSPQDKEIIDLITDAGGRLSGSKHAIDYESSALGDYLTSFRRGRLKIEAMAQAQDIKGAPVMGTVRTVASNIGRIMDSFNKPLFQHYIPAMKTAANYGNMAQWLKNNPGATQAEKLGAARKIVDSVDNRFGEMIHDNIFWNKTAKQTAMLSMLSYSWSFGGWREIGGGVRDIARTAVGKGQWTDKADYVVGTTINWAIMAAAYQYMKTGKPAESIVDLIAPRTGGEDSRTGEPERIIPPGIMKDVFGYYEHFGQEVLNKMNPGLRIAGQSLSILGGSGGKDWRDDPIVSPREEGQSLMDKAPDWLAEYFRFIIKGMSPIQSQQLGRGPEEGSALNPLELGLGIRTAPRQFVDHEGHDAMMQKIWRGKWQKKLKHDQREQDRFGGPVE